MTSPRLWKIWKVSKSLLQRARASLPSPPEAAKTQFDRLDQSFTEYLDHNEHELALDMLEEMGTICSPSGGFWRDLERVALNMELVDRAPAFRSEFNKALDRAKSGEPHGDAD